MYDADPRDALYAEDDRPTRAELDRDEWEAMQQREIMEERYSRTATESEAHAEWHHNTGQRYGCPQDACHPPEDFEPEPEPGEGMRCAHCKGRHWTVEDVKACAAVPRPAAAPAVTYATAIGYAGACEGGRCDVYSRCHAHRAQDAARGDKDAHFRAYND